MIVTSQGTGQYKAEQDFILVAAYVTLLTASPVGDVIDWTISQDPDGGQGSTDFQLIASGLDTNKVTFTSWENLQVPVVKGTTLYWGGSASSAVTQLIFQLAVFPVS